MADNAPGAIQRGLEGGGNLFINRFWTGLYQNRSPLYAPVSAMGIQLIARQDVLWDGHDMMVTPQYSLRRRYGFLRSCPTAFGASEWPLTFFSFENLDGDIIPITDTQTRVCSFSSTGLATIAAKSTGASQTSFNDVADTMYWADGVDAYKQVGPNLLSQSNSFGTSPWGETDATFTTGQTDPNGGTTATKIVWSTTGTTPKVSQQVTPNCTPVASNFFTFSVWMKQNGSAQTVTLLIEDQVANNVIASQTCALTSSWLRYTVTGTMQSSSSAINVFIYNPTTTNAMTVYGAQLEIGTVATTYQGTTTQPQGVYLWGIIAPSVAPTLAYTASGTLQPTIGFQYGYCFLNPLTGHISTMSPASANTGSLNNQMVVQKVTVPASGPYTVTVTNGATFLLDGGVVFDATNAPLTAVASGPTAGQYIAGVAGTGTYTFAAANAGAVVDITYNFSLTASVGVNIVVTGNGSPDPQATIVQIYRTKDGGAEFLLDAQIVNPGGGHTWSYTDSTLDANLNAEIIAPVAFFNNPPPAGMNLICWYAGRLWGAVGNTLYYSAGPDATNGVGEEAWPPGNNYTLPGTITALAATSQGLIIWTRDIAYVTTGTSVPFTTPVPWQVNWGVASQNCVAQDGDNLFIFTTQGQVFNFNANGLDEIGSAEEQQFAAMNPNKVYIVIHRSGQDNGCFVCDGVGNIYRYSAVSTSWDTPIQPVGGCGAIASIEGVDGNWHLYMGRPTGAGYILNRDLNTWTDDGQTFSCFATLGSITVAPPRQVANLEAVLIQATAVGTYPTVSVMTNEITDIGKFPATFTTLPNPVVDPPQLVGFQNTIWMKRHDFKSAQRPLPQHVQHMQIKVSFAAEAQPNEILGIGIAHKAA